MIRDKDGKVLNWVKAAGVIITVVLGLGGLGIVTFPVSAADELKTHTEKCAHYVPCIEQWETKTHAAEVNARQDKLNEKLVGGVESLQHNVILIGERLRVQDLRQP